MASLYNGYPDGKSTAEKILRFCFCCGKEIVRQIVLVAKMWGGRARCIRFRIATNLCSVAVTVVNVFLLFVYR